MYPDNDPKLREQQIIDLLAQRDDQAIQLAYRHYSAALYGIIRRILSDESLAQEALQDTFVKIWKKSTSYDRSKAKLFTWMANIARNTAIDRTRSAAFKNAAKTDDIESLVYSNNTPAVEMNIADSGLATIINSMDENHRVLIDLLYFQGYTQKEASEKINVPLGTLKSRIRAAIKVLRTKLDEQSSGAVVLLITVLEDIINHF